MYRALIDWIWLSLDVISYLFCTFSGHHHLAYLYLPFYLLTILLHFSQDLVFSALFVICDLSLRFLMTMR